ncbi:MAG: response regulator transcription factor [Candidatus Aureabacteria bacterium]|nr:response regulator transcription factor [Candidatus Auribacterota bacterium]
MSIRIFLADDHAVVRDGIKAVIERTSNDIKVIGEADNGREVLKSVKTQHADIYILDISMPILNGIETTDRLLKLLPRCKVIILSMHDDRMFVEKAMECGAKGYILKQNTTEEVVHAIREVYRNKFFLSPQVTKYIVHGFLGKKSSHKEKKKVVDLTKREKEVLQLISEGHSNKEIANEFNLSLNTIHVHRNNIMRKLEIHKQADLIRYALKEGISTL